MTDDKWEKLLEEIWDTVNEMLKSGGSTPTNNIIAMTYVLFRMMNRSGILNDEGMEGIIDAYREVTSEPDKIKSLEEGAKKVDPDDHLEKT